MSASLQKAKTIHNAARDKACQSAIAVVRAETGLSFTTSEWSGRTRQAYDSQWGRLNRHLDGNFDWPAIFDAYRGPSVLNIAIWHGERLCGLAMATVSNSAVRLEYMEREPSDDCPLMGAMIPLVLDACATYAQLRGRAELRLHSVRPSLKSLYVEVYDFEEVTPRKESPYLKRDL